MSTRSDVLVLYFLSPRLILVQAPSTDITIQDLHDTLRDIEDEPANLIYPELISTAGKEDLGGGVFVGLTATLQNAQVMFERRTVLLESGTVTTANADQTVQRLIDSVATFETNGVVPGDIVINDTDNAVGEVLEVVGEDELLILELTGGIDNDFDFGDAYRVFQMVQCEIAGGNLVAVDPAGSPISAVFPTFGTQIIRTSSSSATLQEQADIQYASFDGGVTIDVLSAYSGTIYPTGTPRQPVNNLADADTILTERGFDTFYIRGDITVSTGTFPYVWQGQAPSLTTITLNAGPDPDLAGARFRNATVTGTLDGDAALENCFLQTLNFFNGVINSCVLSGTITLGGGIEAIILDSWSDVGGAIIDMGGSGQDLVLQNFHGNITLTNKTGADQADIGMSSGEVTIDNTVTNGTVTLSGVGTWANELTYSGGATVINRMLSVEDSQQIIFGGGVTVDAVSGTSGTTYPTGTSRQPVDNVPDAVTIANARSLPKLFVIGDLTFAGGDNVADFIIMGQNATLSTITVGAAAVTTNCEYQECTLTGTLDDGVIVRNSIVYDISAVNGLLFQTLLQGTITLGGAAPTHILSCYCGSTDPIIDLGGSGQALFLRNYNGDATLTNKTGVDDVELDLNSGHITLDATVTNGTIVARGVGKLTDTSDNHIRSGSFGGATIINELVSSEEIVAASDDTTYDGVTFSDLLQDLLAMASGRIEESPAGTFTFFERDNTTPRFVLVKAGSVRSRS